MYNQPNSQWSLLGKRYFAPLFWTQFLGAFNDNFFKNALMIMIAFQATILPAGIQSAVAVNISAGLFILPYFLFSGVAGEIADKQEKSRLIRFLKVWEIAILCIAAIGFSCNNIYLLWITLFGLGVQATFFGPVKYSILPQHLSEQELIGGNALVESGTFVAILLGTILGGIGIHLPHGGLIVSLGAILLALVGLFAANYVPLANSANSTTIRWNPFATTWDSLKIAKKNRTVFLSILGISWFWFFGATLLAQFPALVKDTIGGTEMIVTLFLAIFSIGTAIGSLLCEKLSDHKVEIGLVPFGAIGLTVMAFDLYFAFNQFHVLHDASLSIFLSAPYALRMLMDLFLMSVFGGFFIVPLYALIQTRSEPENRSRIIGANNILNALFMVISALSAIAFISLGFGLVKIILMLAIFNTVVAIYIFSLVPEFLLRFISWMLIHTIYRVKKAGLEKVPETGAGLIICNHVSFIDALIIFGSIRRPVKFVMYYKIFQIPVMNYLFRAVGAIPIASKKEDATVLEAAYTKIDEYLAQGELVVIFPEGKITHNGMMDEFKGGILKILEKRPVMLIPSALVGLYGSMFSRKDKTLLRMMPKSFFSRKVRYHVGEPIENFTSLVDVRDKVQHLYDTI